ncbi:hypothetical protein GCM10011349_42570 [Novosphingobium indicum]|uniref:EF-hand domain-containing protein n=1 Tax=Novosphingobium indicum TaxID=462949 RepID=A0ABQ2JXW8_9SPHN|nr:EF-hand domain-containing protein [Novosphingobium indicum]GGN60685.1 hypothetical protein GCM10011349_42570 [Novosphingobium indicum]
MKQTLLHCSLAALAALGFAGTAQAQDADGGGRSTAGGHSKTAFMEAYDANGDGKVSNEEFTAKRADKYKTFDLDGDGNVEEAEYVGEYQGRLDVDLARRRAMQIKQAHVRYGVLDTDEDKNMTIGEFNESGDRMFKRLDTNGDGVIDEMDSADYY